MSRSIFTASILSKLGVHVAAFALIRLQIEQRLRAVTKYGQTKTRLKALADNDRFTEDDIKLIRFAYRSACRIIHGQRLDNSRHIFRVAVRAVRALKQAA